MAVCTGIGRGRVIVEELFDGERGAVAIGGSLALHRGSSALCMQLKAIPRDEETRLSECGLKMFWRRDYQDL
jgi:hypothetical protein